MAIHNQYPPHPLPSMSWIVKKLVSYPTKSTRNDLGINLDLSYITRRVIVCSFPTQRFPATLYRNSLEDLVNYMDLVHKDHWNLWNLRMESLEEYDHQGAGVAGKVNHFPWPDHESPRFQQLVDIVESIDSFLKHDDENVALIHCKLGKGRSGLAAISYLIIKCGLERNEAEKLFTSKRMKSGFGPGASIFSQRRYIEYVELYSVMPYVEQRMYIKGLKVTGAAFNDLLSVQFGIQQYDGAEISKPFVITEVSGGVGDGLFLEVHQEFNPDVRINFQMQNKLGITLSFGYLWFNSFWESKINNGMHVCFNWEQFDGYKGLNKKGYKIFDDVEIVFEII